MYTGINHLHSALRYVLLILLVITVVKAYSAYSKSSPFLKSDNSLSLITMIMVHVQILIGLYLYISNPNVQDALDDMSTAMGDKVSRFLAVEHITGMLIAMIFVTIGRTSIKKKSTDAAKHKAVWLNYGIGLLLILASIPWPFRGLGYGWF